MLAVGGEPVINACDENVVIQAGGCAKNESGIVEAISSGSIVGHRLPGAECSVEIARVAGVQHGGINPDTSRVEGREVGGCKRDQVGVSLQITKDSLAT